MRRTRTQSFLLNLALAILPGTLISALTVSSEIALGAANASISAISGVSNVDDLGTTSMVIYGGTAGPADTCTDNDNVCDNCATTTSGLKACNSARIHPNLRVKFTFKSDKADGRIYIVRTGTSGSTTPLALTSDSASTYTKGTTVTVITTWTELCSHIEGVNADCSTTGTTAGTGAFWVGVDSDNTGTLETADDYAVVNVKVQQFIGQTTAGADETSIAPTCPNSTYGICFYDLGSGDEKAFIKELRSSSFPNGPGLPFRWVRFLYSPTAFTDIKASSEHIDLPVSGTDVSPRRIEGLANKQTYYMKMAMVDAAKNVGYYTGYDSDAGTSNDSYCTVDDYVGGQNGVNCHVVRPDEVVGVLANQQNCFIATAAYGSPLAPEVETFRKFRNIVLLKTDLGTGFVRFYYEHSPRYARMIAKSETLRSLSRAVLWPLSTFAHLSLDYGVGIATAVFAFGLAALAFIMISLRRFMGLVIRHFRATTEGTTRA
jgi:hypothetical protein